MAPSILPGPPALGRGSTCRAANQAAGFRFWEGQLLRVAPNYRFALTMRMPKRGDQSSAGRNDLNDPSPLTANHNEGCDPMASRSILPIESEPTKAKLSKYAAQLGRCWLSLCFGTGSASPWNSRSNISLTTLLRRGLPVPSLSWPRCSTTSRTTARIARCTTSRAGFSRLRRRRR